MHLEYHPTERGVLAWVCARELAGLLAAGFAERVHMGCLIVELCLFQKECLAADADDNDATNAQPRENVIVDWQERVAHLMTADTITFVLAPILGVHPARLRNGGWKEEVDKYLAGGVDERLEVRRVVGMHPSFARAICPRPLNVVVPVASTQDKDDGGFEGDDDMKDWLDIATSLARQGCLIPKLTGEAYDRDGYDDYGRRATLRQTWSLSSVPAYPPGLPHRTNASTATTTVASFPSPGLPLRILNDSSVTTTLKAASPPLGLARRPSSTTIATPLLTALKLLH